MGVKEALLQEGEKRGIQKGEKLGIRKGEKLGIRKGEKLGIRKGEKLGIQKGEKLGIQKGEKLEREKRNYMFVKNLLKQTTFSVPMIASLSGVSEAFVRKVKKELNKLD